MYGVKNGEATPTVWANLGFIRPSATPDGDESTDPSLPVWAQLKEQIDNLRITGSGLPPITAESNGKYLRVKNGVAVWDNIEIPEQYGLVSYNQDKTITIT